MLGVSFIWGVSVARKMMHKPPSNKSHILRDKGMFLAIAAVMLIVVLYVWWFLSNHHKQNETILYTPNKDASSNRYFAAERLLGAKAKSLSGKNKQDALNELWNQDAHQAKNTAVVMYQVANSQTNTLDKMMAWVERGGHLIVANQYSLPSDKTAKDSTYQSKQNPLLVKLGIVYQEYGFDVLSEQKEFVYYRVPLRLPNQQAVVVEGELGRFDTTTLKQQYPFVQLQDYHLFDHAGGFDMLKQPAIVNMTADEQTKMTAAFKQEKKLFDPNMALVDLSFGQGRLTVLSTAQMFVNPKVIHQKPKQQSDNKTINQSNVWRLLTDRSSDKPYNYQDGIVSAHHASFLKHLTDGRQSVYFVPDIESIGFFALLWRHLPWTIIGFGVLIVCGLLALPKRFGALMVYQTDTSRNIFGFFGHVGRYLWVSDKAVGLMSKNRQALLQTILAKEQINDSSAQVVIPLISQKTGLSAGLVYDALYQDWQNQREFLRISRSFAQLVRHYG